MCQPVAQIVTQDQQGNLDSKFAKTPQGPDRSNHHTNIAADHGITIGVNGWEFECYPIRSDGSRVIPVTDADGQPVAEARAIPVKSWEVLLTGPTPAAYSSQKDKWDTQVRRSTAQKLGLVYDPNETKTASGPNVTPSSVKYKITTPRITREIENEGSHTISEGNILMVAEDRFKDQYALAFKNAAGIYFVVATPGYKVDNQTPFVIGDAWNTRIPASMLNFTITN